MLSQNFDVLRPIHVHGPKNNCGICCRGLNLISSGVHPLCTDPPMPCRFQGLGSQAKGPQLRPPVSFDNSLDRSKSTSAAERQQQKTRTTCKPRLAKAVRRLLWGQGENATVRWAIQSRPGPLLTFNPTSYVQCPTCLNDSSPLDPTNSQPPTLSTSLKPVSKQGVQKNNDSVHAHRS